MKEYPTTHHLFGRGEEWISEAAIVTRGQIGRMPHGAHTGQFRAAGLVALAEDHRRLESDAATIVGIHRDCDGTADGPLEAYNGVLIAFERAITDRAEGMASVRALESNLETEVALTLTQQAEAIEHGRTMVVLEKRHRQAVEATRTAEARASRADAEIGELMAQLREKHEPRNLAGDPMFPTDEVHPEDTWRKWKPQYDDGTGVADTSAAWARRWTHPQSETLSREWLGGESCDGRA